MSQGTRDSSSSYPSLFFLLVLRGWRARMFRPHHTWTYFGLSGVFSCFYHWDKLTSLRRSYAVDIEGQLPPSKSTLPRQDMKQKQSVPVIMAGDQMPKFMALPCPCEPPREEKLVVKILKPPKSPRFPTPRSVLSV